MLILPKGYQTWKDLHDKYTPGRHDGRKLPHETGYRVEKQDSNEPTREQLRYELPNWFCVDCESVVVPTNNDAFCIHMAHESYPGLDIKKGQAFAYYICEPCIHEAIWGKARIWTPGVSRQATQQAQRESIAIRFLQSLSPDDREYITVKHHATVRDEQAALPTPTVSNAAPEL
jgi:hypothetical protein